MHLSFLTNFLSDMTAFESVEMTPNGEFHKVIPDSFSESMSLVSDKLITHLPFFSHLIEAPKIVSLPQNGIIGYLAGLFGYKRFERICQMASIDLQYRATNFLYRFEVEAFCLHAAEVYERDFQELLTEIQSGSKVIRFLDEQQSLLYRKKFEGVHNLDDCSNTHFDELFSLLIPHAVTFNLFSKSVSNDRFAEIWRKVTLYEKMRGSIPSESQWFMTVAKRIVDRELSEGIVFRNGHGGFCKVHQIVSQDGAYKCFLKHIGKDSKHFRNVIVYRGSSTRDMQTFVEDMRSEFGAQGPKATFEKTHELLMDPAMGFIRIQQESVIGVGMSLGACQLMRDAALFGSKIGRIITFAGPGPDRATMELYAKTVNNRKSEGIEIEHSWEADDVNHYFGESHLGAGCDPKKVKISVYILGIELSPVTESIEIRLKRIAEKMRFPEAESRNTEIMRGIAEVNRALNGPHCRNTLEEENTHILHLNNQEHPELVDQLLHHDPSLICDPRWEEMRQITAIKSEESFVDYVQFMREAYSISVEK